MRQNHKTQGSEANRLPNYLPTKQKLARRCSKNKMIPAFMVLAEKKYAPPTKIICEMFLKRKEQEEAFSRGIKTSPHLFSVLWTQAHEWHSPVATPSVFQPVAQIIHEIHEAHDYQWHYKTPLALVCWSSAEKTAVAPFSDQPGSRLLSDLLTLYRSLHAKQELALFIFLPTRSHYALPFLLKSVIHKMDQVGIWDVQPCSCFSNMFDVQ